MCGVNFCFFLISVCHGEFVRLLICKLGKGSKCDMNVVNVLKEVVQDFLLEGGKVTIKYLLVGFMGPLYMDVPFHSRYRP